MKCPYCGRPVFRQTLGRPARYCSASCRQMAYLKRRLRPRLGIRSQPSGNDHVQTPLRLARALSATLQPSGTILEPCSGDGHFVQALQPFGVVAWCEITRGRDFFAWTEHVDWCVGNPPWSRYRAFLAHALGVADHVAFVSTLNHLWTKSRRALVRRAGFGLEKIIEFDAPREWPSTGFQLGMVLLTRGYHGPCAVEALVSYLWPDASELDLVGR